MPLFSFKITSFEIIQTRSAHTDTDYACVTVQTSTFPNNLHTVTSPNLGNLNNGTFNINFGLEGLTIYPDSPVVFNYLIFNSGTFTELAVNNTLKAIGQDLVSKSAPGGSALAYVQRQYAHQLGLLTKAGSCDGLVAAEQNNFTYEQIIGLLSPSYAYAAPPIDHRGVAIPKGCNSSPSEYITNWSVSEVVDLSSLIQIGQTTVTEAKIALAAAKLGFAIPLSEDVASYFITQASPSYPVVNGKVTLQASKNKP